MRIFVLYVCHVSIYTMNIEGAALIFFFHFESSVVDCNLCI